MGQPRWKLTPAFGTDALAIDLDAVARGLVPDMWLLHRKATCQEPNSHKKTISSGSHFLTLFNAK